MQTEAIKGPRTLVHSRQNKKKLSMGKAKRHAEIYVRDALGIEYTIYGGVVAGSVWRFLIQCESPLVERPVIVGSVDVKIDVDEPLESKSDLAVPLSETNIQKIRERAEILISDQSGTLPLDENGYIVAPLAVRNVKAYLAQHVSLFAQPLGEPIWLDKAPPYWQVSTNVQLSNKVTLPLPPISVNGKTGDVVPLTAKKLLEIQKLITDATPHPTQSTTAAV